MQKWEFCLKQNKLFVFLSQYSLSDFWYTISSTQIQSSFYMWKIEKMVVGSQKEDQQENYELESIWIEANCINTVCNI